MKKCTKYEQYFLVRRGGFLLKMFSKSENFPLKRGGFLLKGGFLLSNRMYYEFLEFFISITGVYTPVNRCKKKALVSIAGKVEILQFLFDLGRSGNL